MPRLSLWWVTFVLATSLLRTLMLFYTHAFLNESVACLPLKFVTNAPGFPYKSVSNMMVLHDTLSIGGNLIPYSPLFLLDYYCM